MLQEQEGFVNDPEKDPTSAKNEKYTRSFDVGLSRLYAQQPRMFLRNSRRGGPKPLGSSVLGCYEEDEHRN